MRKGGPAIQKLKLYRKRIVTTFTDKLNSLSGTGIPLLYSLRHTAAIDSEQ